MSRVSAHASSNVRLPGDSAAASAGITRTAVLDHPIRASAHKHTARRLAAIAGRRDGPAIEFLQYSLAGQAVTPVGTAFSVADNLIWALGAYLEKKGRESGRRYLQAGD